MQPSPSSGRAADAALGAGGRWRGCARPEAWRPNRCAAPRWNAPRACPLPGRWLLTFSSAPANAAIAFGEEQGGAAASTDRAAAAGGREQVADRYAAAGRRRGGRGPRRRWTGPAAPEAGPAPTRPASVPGHLCRESDRRATGRPVIAAPARAARPPRPVPSSPISRYTDALASRTPPFLLGEYGSSHPLASRTFSLSVIHRRGRASSCSHAMPDSLEIAASSLPSEAGPPLADVDSALLCW